MKMVLVWMVLCVYARLAWMHEAALIVTGGWRG